MIPLPQRPAMRRAVVILPNGFTLGNLFFGIWAIVAAARGDFNMAGWFVVLGGVMDALDGRVARMTRTGSAFGVELDSLVDAISFGTAPALIMYFAVLNRDSWAWLLSFLFTAAAVMRLARFNVEQGGRAKTHFHGLPSPAAGMTLASYYWFSQSPLYTQTAVGDIPWVNVMPWVMLLLAFLMISHVPYAAVPTITFRTRRQALASAVVIAVAVAFIVSSIVIGFRVTVRNYLFPALVLYAAWGLLKAFALGLLERVPTQDPLLDEDDEPEGDAAYTPDDRPIEIGEHPVPERRRRDRRHGAAG